MEEAGVFGKSSGRRQLGFHSSWLFIGKDERYEYLKVFFYFLIFYLKKESSRE